MPFPDSFKLATLKVLTAHLEGIKPENDPLYTIDLTGRVFRGRLTFGQEELTSATPWAVSILEAPKPDFVEPVGDKTKRNENWNLLVQGFVPNDLNNPSDPAYYLLACVEKRLAEVIATKQSNGMPEFPAVYRLGGRISDMFIGQGIVRPAEQGVSNAATFYMPVTLRLATTTRDPFGGAA